MMDKLREFDPLLFEPNHETTEAARKGSADITSTESTNVDSKEVEVEKDEFLIDLSEEVTELDYTLEINGIPTFPKGDIQGIKARAKHGKTHTLLCLIIALFKGHFLSIKSKIQQPKVCYFATEEHRNSLMLLVRKVHKLCEWNINKNHRSFKVYTLRRQTPKERSEYICMQIRKDKPDIVFIDGIRDLLYDFNNIQESNATITSLLKTSEESHCAIVNVLHTNKGSSDSNMRGHLGTELQNKCSDILEVEKKGSVFCVKETDCRNMLTGKWAFSLDENALPQEAVVIPKKENRVEKMIQAFSTILAKGNVLSFTELKKAYMKISGFKIDAAHKHIGEMTKKGFLKKTSDDRYQLS